MSSSLWSKNFCIDVVTNFIVYLVFYLITIIIVDFAMSELNASPSGAGLAAGIFIVAGLVGRIIAGKLIAPVGLKKILFAGLIISLVASVSYFIAVNLFLLDIVRFMHGLGFGITSTATGTIVAKIIPKNRYGTGIGYYALSVSVATAVGPFVGMYLHQHGNFSLIIIVCIILSVINFILALFLQVPKFELTREQQSEMKSINITSFFEYKALPIAMVGALMAFCYSSVVSFLSAYTHEIDLTAAGSLFFIVYAVCIVVSRPFVGKMFDDKNENYVIYPVFVFFSLGLFMLGMADGQWLLLAAGVFIGLGYGNFTPIGQAIAIRKAPSHHVGLATSTFYAVFDAGMGIGPFILGFIVSSMGFRMLYVVMAGVIIITLILYYFVHGRQVDRREN